MPEPIVTTARTARHGFPYLFPGQAQKEAFVNEAFARIDSLLQPAVLGERADPPADPATGDCHIVGSAPTGAWSGQAGALAIWVETQWLFAAPVVGEIVFDSASGCRAVFDDEEGWRRAGTPALPDGGETQDAEARAAITAIIDGLQTLGIFA